MILMRTAAARHTTTPGRATSGWDDVEALIGAKLRKVLETHSAQAAQLAHVVVARLPRPAEVNIAMAASILAIMWQLLASARKILAKTNVKARTFPNHQTLEPQRFGEQLALDISTPWNMFDTCSGILF